MTWALLYKAGGWSALLYVLLVLVPVVLVFAAPLPPTDGAAVLAYIAAHQAVYLAELVCFVGLAVPALVVFTAVAVALKGVDKSIAAIGGLFGIASEVIEPPRVQWRVLGASSRWPGRGFGQRSSSSRARWAGCRCTRSAVVPGCTSRPI